MGLFFYVTLSYVDNFKSYTFSADFKLMIKNFFTQKKTGLLVIPKLPKNINELKYFKDHWKSDNGYFVLLTRDLETKISPDLEAENYDKLYKTQRVQVLFENTHSTTIDGVKRNWVFLASESGRQYLGWTFKDYLVTEKNFEVFENIDTGFSFKRGQMKAQLIIEERGRFKYNWQASGGGLILNGSEEGQVYIYEDIIWTKKDNQDYLYDFFLFDDTNHVQQEFRFRNEVITMNLYQFLEEEFEGE